MKKIIKLTERDINRIVKRVLIEQIDVSIAATNMSIPIPSDITVKPLAIAGSLLIGGIKLISQLIKNKRKKQLNELLHKVNTLLERELNTAERQCISSELSKMGKITKLNDNVTSKVTNAMYHCLGDIERVEEIKIKLNNAIQDIEDEVERYEDNKYEKKRKKREMRVKKNM